MVYSQYKTTTKSKSGGSVTIYHGSGTSNSSGKSAAQAGREAVSAYRSGRGGGDIVEVVSSSEEAKRNAETASKLKAFKEEEAKIITKEKAIKDQLIKDQKVAAEKKRLLEQKYVVIKQITGMPKVDTSLMTFKEKLKYYYQTADIKARGYLPGGATPTEIAARNYVAPEQTEYYFGDKVVSLKPKITPTFGGSGTPITSFGISDIEVETPKTTFEQYILPPGTKIALTGFNKELYIPDMATAEKLNQIIKYDDIKSYNKFVSEQQAQYKKDIGQYNLLQAQLSSQEEITQEEANKINVLGQRIQTGYKGTLKDVTRTAIQERGTTGAAWLYSGLRAGQTTYDIEKTYLAFKLGGGVAGTLLPAKVISTIAGSKTVSTLGRLYVPSLIGGSALRTGAGFVKGEYAPEYLGESVGILLGGLGSYYSKQVVEGGWRLTKATGRGLKFVGERLGQTGYKQPKLVRGKRGSQQLMQSYEEDVYIRDAEGRIIGTKPLKKKLKMTPEQAAEQFKKFTRSEQAKLLEEEVFRKRVYLDEQSLQKDLELAKQFMKKAGLTDAQISDRLALVSLKAKMNLLNQKYLSKQITLEEYNLGKTRIQEAELRLRNMLQQSLTKVETPSVLSIGSVSQKPLIVESRGALKPLVKSQARPDVLKYFDSSFQKPVSVTRTITKTISGTQVKTRTLQKPMIAVAGKFAEQNQIRSLFGIASLNQQREKQKERFAYSPMSATLSVSKEAQLEKQVEQQVSATRSLFGIAQVSPTVQEQPTIQEPRVGFPSPRPRRPEPRKPIEPVKKPFGFEIPDFERKKKGFIDKPYDAFVKVDATKKQKAKWVLVADNVPLVTALSRGGGFVDDNPSNRFRVEPAKGKLNKIVDVAWNQLSNKFREYSQKGGVKVGLRPGHYIEKRKYRIDSPNERRAIPQAGRVAIARKFGRI